MGRLAWLLGGAVVVGAGLTASRAFGKGGAINVDTSDYVPDPDAPYGPHWRHQRPPGLPVHARGCSTAAEGEHRIIGAAAAAGVSADFVRFVRALGHNESGLMLGRPANIFDARCSNASAPDSQHRCEIHDGPRPAGVILITAWGWAQWNHLPLLGVVDAGQGMRLPTMPARPDLVRALPHDLSLADELTIPIQTYRAIWLDITGRGGTSLDAARACWAWHDAPGDWWRYRQTRDFASAWQGVGVGVAGQVDHKLHANGFV